MAACDSDTLSRQETCDTIVTPFCEHVERCFATPVDWCVDQTQPLCEDYTSDRASTEAVDKCLQAIESAECPSDEPGTRTINMPEECEDL